MKHVLISGGGIAGLTLALLLKKSGWSPVVIERAPSVRTEGYMMDFFGTGWDVAKRIGLIEDIKKVVYPVDKLEFVGKTGQPWLSVPLETVRQAMDNEYTYLRRSDLERILYTHIKQVGIEIRFGSSIATLTDTGNKVDVQFESGTKESFDLVIGADGARSRVRELVFGTEKQFEKYLGYYVAAFHLPNHYGLEKNFITYQRPGRSVLLYPLDKKHIDVTFIFSSPNVGFVPLEKQHAMLHSAFSSDQWVIKQILNDIPQNAPLFFDSLTQIRLPQWSKGRIALIGDACGCLTLAAGQGSHMAMAGAYVLHNELMRHNDDHPAAFSAYEKILHPIINKKQTESAKFANIFLTLLPALGPIYHALLRASFHPIVIHETVKSMGAVSALKDYSSV